MATSSKQRFLTGTELRFLNPGIETCVAHCNRRPWEPSKFSSTEQQDAMLSQLIQWVQEYQTRDDEYGLKRHRQVFDRFSGPKHDIHIHGFV